MAPSTCFGTGLLILPAGEVTPCRQVCTALGVSQGKRQHAARRALTAPGDDSIACRLALGSFPWLTTGSPRMSYIHARGRSVTGIT